MKRRHLLSQTGAAATLALAGCSVLGSGDESTPTAESLNASIDYHAADDGDLIAVVTVTNTASEPVSGTLYIDLTVDGSTNTRVRTVEVQAAGTREVTAEFDGVSVEKFTGGNASLSTRWGYQAE